MKINYADKIQKRVNLDFIKDDFWAGLSVAALALPQNMAYALIVGVNPIYGLYTSIVSMLIATLVGSSNYMVVGPTNLMSMALASSLSLIDGSNYLQALFLLTLMVGIIQFLFGILKLGNLVNYISHSVIIGLTTGAALIISVGQLKNLFGLSIAKSSNLFTTLYLLGTKFDNINPISLFLGLITICSIILFDKFNDEAPSYLMGIIIATIVVYVFNLDSFVKIVGNLPTAIPSLNLFKINFSLGHKLLSKALSVAIIGLMQTLAIVKSLEDKSRQEVDINQEFMGQGIINTLSSLFNSFASAGSFTNSFVNYQAGAKTRFSEFFTAIAIMLFVFVFNPIVSYIPISSLAGLVILAAYQMIDVKEILKTFQTTKSDAIIFIVTFMAVILLPSLDYAIYIGVIISLLIVLRESSKVKMSHIDYDQKVNNKLTESSPDKIDKNNYSVIELAGNLQFSAADNFKEKLNEVFVKEKTFIIRMRNIKKIDLTSLKELDKFIIKVQGNNGQVLLSGLEDKVYRSLNNFGIIEKIGKNNIFRSQNELLSSTIKAVEFAEEDIKNE